MSNFFGLLQTGGMWANAGPDHICGGGSGQDFEYRVLFTWMGSEDGIIVGRQSGFQNSLVLRDVGGGTEVRFNAGSTTRAFLGPTITKGAPHLITMRRVNNVINAFVDGVQYGGDITDSVASFPQAFNMRNGVISEPGCIVWYLESDRDGVPDRRFYNRDGTGTSFVCEISGISAGIINGTGDNSQWVQSGGAATPSSSIWIGHHTKNSVIVSAKVQNSATCRVVCSLTDDFATTIESSELTPDSFGIVRGTVSGLAPGQHYYVSIKYDNDSIESNRIGQFATVPNTPTVSEKIAFASCAESISQEIFDNIADKNDELSFFFNLGDMHYADITVNDEALYQFEYDRVTGSSRYGRLFRDLPTYYMWDDHDYGANNVGASSPSRQAALLAFRRRVPTPTLVRSGAEEAVYYSFVRGRVRYIATDLRSEMSDNNAPAGPDKVKMSQQQLDWFESECLAAKAAGQVICWANTVPWIGSGGTGSSDIWGNYSHQRTTIANFITSNELSDRMFIISGDAHMLAYDDGTNAPAGIPVLQAAPLDRANSTKGGPYTAGPVTDSQSQYGIMEITDNGGETISVNFQGIVVNRSTGDETVAINETFTLQAGSEPVQQRELVLNIQGIPNGTYNVRLFNSAAGTFIETASLTFAGGEATYSTELATGTVIEGYILDGNEPPENGAIIYGTVTDA